MKYQQLLFSRSTNLDYRWMIVPTNLTTNDLRFLEDLIWSDNLRAYFDQTPEIEITPTFLVKLTNSFVLVQITRTNLKDFTNKRYIDALQGISVDKNDIWPLRFSLAWILNDYKALLNIWQSLEKSKADDFIRKPSAILTFDWHILDRGIKLVNPIEQKLEPNKKFHLSFDKAGYNQLINLLYPHEDSYTLTQVQFAFGFLKEDESKFLEFEIVAPYTQIETKSHASSLVISPIVNSPTLSSLQLTNKSSLQSSKNFDELVESLSSKSKKNESSKTNNQESILPKSIIKVIRTINPFKR